MKNKNLFQSICCAARGLFIGLKSERNFISYGIIASIFLILNILLQSNAAEFIIYIVVSCGVFSAEFINTAIERAMDYFAEEVHHKIRDIKDIAAGAVLVQGIVFFAAEAVILLPKIFNLAVSL